MLRQTIGQGQAHDRCAARTLVCIGALLLAGTAAADPPSFVIVQAAGWSGLNSPAISGDGTVVVGRGCTANYCSAGFRWTAAEGIVNLGHLSGFPGGTHANGVNLDGSVIVGGSYRPWNEAYEAFRWTPSGGIEGLGYLPTGFLTPHSYALAVTADGSVIVGESRSAAGFVACRWVAGQGAFALASLPGWTYCRATAVSGDGQVIAGTGRVNDTDRAFRWSEATGMQDLGVLPGGTRSTVDGISADGQTIVGISGDSAAALHRAFRWTAGDGMQALPMLPGTTVSRAHGVNGDGSVIVGTSGGRACLWIEGQDVIDLREHLLQLGVTVSLETLQRAAGISSDGRTIVGETNATITWIAYLGTASGACYANCDDSTVEPILNVDDFLCFIAEFAAATTIPHEQQLTHYANCAGSTVAPVLNVDDFLCFVAAFAQGCP